MAVGLVDELPQIVRSAIEACRREPADAVVAPTELTGELRDWHQLNRLMPSRFKRSKWTAAAAHVPSDVNVPVCNS